MTNRRLKRAPHAGRAAQNDLDSAIMRLTICDFLERVGAQDEQCVAMDDALLERLRIETRAKVAEAVRRAPRAARSRAALGCTAGLGLRIALCVICFVFIGSVAAYALSADVRDFVHRLIVRDAPTYTLLQMNPAEQNGMASGHWAGRYGLGYIPEGFSLVQNIGDGRIMLYENANHDTLSFSMVSHGTSEHIDTEDTIKTEITLFGVPAYHYAKPGYTVITWALDDTIFVVMSEGSVDYALPVAQSVVPLDQSL